MTLTAGELVDELLLLIAETEFYDARSLRIFADMPSAQREIVADALYRELPIDKQQTIEWRLKRIISRWDKAAAE